MDKLPHAEGGLLPSVTRLFKTLCDVAENRVELFVLEWREERLRLVDVLLLLLGGAVCALMALLAVTVAVLMAFWDTHRELVLTLIILAYVGGAAAAFWKLRAQLCRWQAFSETLEQIKKDRACFKPKS